MSPRTLLAALLPGLVCAGMWARLEQPRESAVRLAVVVALATAAAFARPRTVVAPAAIVVAARVAFGFWLHPLRLAGRFGNGFLDFYDVRTPFDPRTHADMRSVILVACFASALAVAAAVASRRPVLAVLAVLGGAGWPATLAADDHGLAKGVVVLAALLLVLVALSGRRPPWAVAPVAAALVLASVAAAGSSAIAKGELVAWQRWDFYTAPAAPVSVRYVWDAQYGGIRFPAKRTTVLEIEAGPRALYWRAALLDDFVADRWRQGPVRRGDWLEPPAAARRAGWRRQDVTVEALSDTRLVGGGVPVRFDAGAAPLVRPEPGVALLPSGLTRGLHYTAWSYAPQPTPAQLDRSLPRYPAALTSFRAVWPGVVAPPFGAPGRAALLDAHPEIEPYVPLARTAETVAGGARTPYAAAIALQSWLRTTGGFTYSNHPFVFSGAPLVGFVVQTRSGYCQYFAGAMALMLRYLGIPARVAVGFSSGTYDARRHTWTVTDHDAHAWVEAWFRGYGWLPFDPTPPAGRPEQGLLDAPYVAARATVAPGVPPSGPAPASQAHRHGETGTATALGAAGTAALPRERTSHPSLLLLLAGLAGAILVGVAVTKLAVRSRRVLARDPRHVAAACRNELAGFLLDQRIEAARSATLHELGELVRLELAVDPERFVRAATAARFGPPAGAGAAARAARRELRALLSSVRARLTMRERVRGLLSLRSLGFAAKAAG